MKQIRSEIQLDCTPYSVLFDEYSWRKAKLAPDAQKLDSRKTPRTPHRIIHPQPLDVILYPKLHDACLLDSLIYSQINATDHKMLSSPLNLPKWYVHALSTCHSLTRCRLEENSHLLQPPVNNYCVYNKDVTVMVSASLSKKPRKDHD